GMIGPANDINLFKQNYKTPEGYKYQTPANSSLAPGEALVLNTDGTDYMDYFWNQLAVSDDQTTNRVIAAATLNYDILKNLHFRGRVGEDYTGYFSEDKEPSQYPVAYGYSGYYGTNFNRYNFTYGDLLLTYNQKITNNFDISLSAGYQARTEDYRYSGQGTSGGLTQGSWFSMSASANPVTGSSTRSYLVKDGLFGILDLSYHNYLFIEATGRRERSSTLYPGNNTFFYPGVSGSFELSNAFHLPAFVTYSKLRASWAIVGNPGVPYQANVVYNAYSDNGIPTLTTPNPYGNQNLKDEKKHAVEFGWETKLFNDRFGFDISWYHNRIHDQILNLEVPASTGVTGVLENVGTMQNIGLEIALNGTPVQTPNFQWNVTLNWARNHNTVLSLMPGLQRLVSSNMDNGSLLIVSEVGKAAGEIMTYKLERNAAGQLITAGGYYVPNFDSMVNDGNVQSKFVGGLINDFRYKGFDLNIV
ncbi:MAG: TonB-dependent receptor domain-containing protein, partial [Chitinophagaceae bacterium]